MRENRLGRGLAAAMVALLLASGASAQGLPALFGSPDAPTGEELEELIEAAQDHPLGSQENPVRAEMPPGQRAYLNRLRCKDGNAPRYERVGNFGVGVYGRIIDGYAVVCEGSEPAESMIFMDMYHPGHVEGEAVPGFAIVGSGSAATKK